MTPRHPIGKREACRNAESIAVSSAPHLEKGEDRERSLETAWCADSWRGERLRKGWGWREQREANKPPSLPKYTETPPKTGGFSHFLT